MGLDEIYLKAGIYESVRVLLSVVVSEGKPIKDSRELHPARWKIRNITEHYRSQGGGTTRGRRRQVLLRGEGEQVGFGHLSS